MSSQTSELLLEAVRHRLGSAEFRVVESAEEAADEQIGFMSCHSRAHVRVRHRGREHDLHFFVKRAITLQHSQELFSQSFRKEEQFYNHLLNPLVEANRQDVHQEGQPCEAEWLEEPEPCFAPRCYLATEEVVIMQDLRKLGFRPVDSSWVYDGLDAHTARAVLRALAALHASSLLLEHAVVAGSSLGPAQRAPLLLHESLFTSDREATGPRLLQATAEAQALEVLPRMLPDSRVAPGLLQRLQSAVLGSVSLLDVELMRRCAGSDVMVACHGDPWPNNVMVRLDADGRAERAVLVDFQFSRWAPPAVDVLMFLCISCRRSLRDRELGSFLNGYHAELQRRAAAGGLDLSSVLPLSAFLHSAKLLLPVARAIACSYLSVCAAPVVSLTQVLGDPHSQELFMKGENRRQLMADWFSRSPDYRRRLEESLREMLGLS